MRRPQAQPAIGRLCSRPAVSGRSVFALVTLALASGGLLLVAAPASAAKIHAFTTTFGAASSSPANPYPLTNPQELAVDNSSDASQGDVYVVDTDNDRVEKFDPEGHLILMFGKGVDQTGGGDVCTVVSGHACQAGASGSSPGEFQTPTFIAVDGSSGPSAGDVYVADTSDNVISKFSPSGNLVASWASGGQLSGVTTEIGGLTVDSAGNLYVLSIPEPAELFKYSESGVPITHFLLGPRATSAFGIAVDLGGFVYKVTGTPNVERYSSTGEELGQVDDREDATGITVNPANGDLYVAQGQGLISRYGENCLLNSCVPVETFGGGSLTTPRGVAIDKITGTVYTVQPSGTVAVLDEGILPEAATETATNIGLYSGEVHGTVGPGGGDIVSCRFDYGTSTAYSLGSIPCNEAPPFSSSTAVTADISGLVNNTTYHYRAVASNGKLTSFGQDQKFTTLPAVEGLSTDAATEITGTSGTINGSWSGNGEDTHYFFEWGFTSLYGNKTAVSPGEDGGSGHAAVHESFSLSGLGATTTYHYRIAATNAQGTTFGLDRTFTTLTFPIIKVLQTTELESTAARLNAMVEPTSGAVSGCQFEYGPNAGEYNIGTAPCEPVPPFAANTEVGAKISGLAPGTAYHYRLDLISAAGTASEPDQVFTTAPLLPAIISTTITSTTSGGAIVNSDITPGFGPTLYFIEYGESVAYGASSAVGGPLAADNDEHLVTTQLVGLKQNRTYHLRAVAINFGGATRGLDQTFVTPGVPQVVSAFASNVAARTVSLGAQIVPGQEATTFHFDYGTGNSFSSRTAESSPIGSDALPHSATATLTGLAPNTTYHFRAVATNAIGVARGVEGIFTTLPAEEIEQSPSPVGCRVPLVRRHGKCVRKHHPKRKKTHRKRSAGNA